MDLFLIYVICFGVGLLFTLLSAVMSGGGDGGEVHADGHADAGGGGHDMPGFSALSPTTIATFITAFGGFGMILARIEATKSPFVSAPLAVLGAFAVAAAVLSLFRRVFSATQSSSESRTGSLVGHSATVLTPISADGVGEIAYVDGGSRYNAPARSEGGLPIASGRSVVIKRIVGSSFFVAES